MLLHEPLQMKNRVLTSIFIVVTLFLPVAVFAQSSPDLGYFEEALISIGALIEQLIPILIGIGLLFFIWGLVQFIIASGDEAAKEVGKRRMVWGILALFVIVAVWGLVGLLAGISGIEVGGNIDAPGVNF